MLCGIKAQQHHRFSPKSYLYATLWDVVKMLFCLYGTFFYISNVKPSMKQ